MADNEIAGNKVAIPKAVGTPQKAIRRAMRLLHLLPFLLWSTVLTPRRFGIR